MKASPGQRVKVSGQPCIVCGSGPCDPAHVAASAQGGCQSPDCVVPLCREHHRAFDTRRLDLLPFLEPRFRLELAHAVGHLGLIGTLRRVTADRDVAYQERAAA